MERVKKAEGWLVRGEQAALAVLLAFMVTLAFVQVVLRQIGMRAGWSLSVLWGDTLLRHLVLWVGFLGAGVAAAHDKQFAMDAGTQFLSRKARARVGIVCHLFSALVCVGLARAAWMFLAEERAGGGVLFNAFGLDVMAWWLEAAAPVGFALLFLHYALKTLEIVFTPAPSPSTALGGEGERPERQP